MYSSFVLIEKSIYADNYFNKSKLKKSEPEKLVDSDSLINQINQKELNTKIINSLPTSGRTK